MTTFKRNWLQKLSPAIAVVSFTALVLFISYNVLKNIEQDLKQQTHNTLQSVSAQSYRTYNLWIDDYLEGAYNLANNEQLAVLVSQALGNTNNDDLSALHNYIHPHIKENAINGYQVITPEGKILLGSGLYKQIPSQILKHHKDRFEQALSGKTLTIPPLIEELGATPYDDDNLTQRHTLYFLSPIYDEQHNVIAILALLKPIQGQLSELISGGRIGHSGETYLLNSDGYMLTESRYSRELQQMGILSPSVDDLSSVKLIVPNRYSTTERQPKTQSSQLTLMAYEINRKASGYSIDGYLDYRGEPVYGVWLWDERTGMGIATEIDQSEADSAFITMTFSVAVLNVLVIIAGIGLTYFLTWLQHSKEHALIETQESLEKQVKSRTLELQDALETLHTQATTDVLTQLPNRRYFDDHYEQAWQQCSRDKKKLGVIMMDVDFFKQYNDSYGHQAGDTCLTNLGKVLSELKLLRRPLDHLARYGGEEFVIVLADTNPDYVIRVAEIIRHNILSLEIPHQYRADNLDIVSVSLGVSCAVPNQSTHRDELINLADEALYQAKKDGRNSVSVSKHTSCNSALNTLKRVK